ncbi:hypothetical protein D3C85_1722260 [compost metagenome]
MHRAEQTENICNIDTLEVTALSTADDAMLHINLIEAHTAHEDSYKALGRILHHHHT